MYSEHTGVYFKLSQSSCTVCWYRVKFAIFLCILALGIHRQPDDDRPGDARQQVQRMQTWQPRRKPVSYTHLIPPANHRDGIIIDTYLGESALACSTKIL